MNASLMESPVYNLSEESPLHNFARLKDVYFNDIFFNEAGNVFLRGLESPDPGENVPVLTSVPRGCLEDTAALHVKVMREASGKDECFVDFDGMRFRVSKIVTVGEVWYTLRKQLHPIPRLLGTKGLHPKLIQELGRIGDNGRSNPNRKQGRGLILICGRTGAGKSTLAFSLLQQYLLTYGDIAVTIEDPIEMNMSGMFGADGRGWCFQTEVQFGDFKDAMRKTMRRTPRYILLGETRGGDEASEALRAGINGHLVITTIHAGSVIEGLDAMLKFVAGREPMELARSVLASGIAAVLHIDLVRQPGSAEKMLKVESLFATGSDENAIRACIRSGKTEQLVNKIQAQAARIAADRNPTDPVVVERR